MKYRSDIERFSDLIFDFLTNEVGKGNITGFSDIQINYRKNSIMYTNWHCFYKITSYISLEINGQTKSELIEISDTNIFVCLLKLKQTINSLIKNNFNEKVLKEKNIDDKDEFIKEWFGEPTFLIEKMS